MNPISAQIHIGTIGELLVALRLLQYGVQAAPPIKDSGNDLIAVRGEVFRAVQVKTTQSDCFRLNRLPNLYHLVALVRLVGEDKAIYLDESEIFLLEKTQISTSLYKTADLGKWKISESLVDQLFMNRGIPSETTHVPSEIPTQRPIERRRR